MGVFDIIKSLIPLIAVLGLLFGILVLVKRHSFSLNSKKLKNIHVEVIHNEIILPKKYLSIVRVKDKILVLGISENNISLLKELDHDGSDDYDSSSITVKQNFMDILKQNLGMK